MSFVVYNNILLDRTKLIHYHKQAAYAGRQYLYTAHTVTLEGVYNPALNSYVLGRRGLLRRGAIAPVTEAAVRNDLMMPRKSLVYSVGGVAMLVSPQLTSATESVSAAAVVLAILGGAASAITGSPAAALGQPLEGSLVAGGLPAGGFTGAGAGATVAGYFGYAEQLLSRMRQQLRNKQERTDAANGPIPGPMEIIENTGDKTFLLRWTFQTHLHENFQKGNLTYPQSPLLAHEWSMSHSVDQDFFTTRVIDGRAVFRSDVLARKNLTPDRLRYWIGHPVPLGFRRDRVWVRALPDGVTYEYQITDRERKLIFDPNYITRIEAMITTNVRRAGLEEMLGTVRWNPALNGATFGIAPLSAVPLLGAAAQWIAATIQGGGVPARFQGVPMRETHVRVRVWGHPAHDNRDLAQRARNWARNRLTELGLTVNLGQVGLAVQIPSEYETTTVDESGSFAEYSFAQLSSISGAIQDVLLPPRPPPGGIGDGDAPAVNNDVIHAHPMRGRYLGQCVARALREPGETWDQADDPRWVSDTNNNRDVNSQADAVPGVINP